MHHPNGDFYNEGYISGRQKLFVTPWTAACQASLSFTISQSLLKLMSYLVSDAIQPSHPLSSPSPAFSLSQHQGLFQWVGCLHQVARVLELQLQHQSFQLMFRVSFRTEWFDLLAVQGTLRVFFSCCCCKVASVVSNSVRPHRWQPTRLPCPWEF